MGGQKRKRANIFAQKKRDKKENIQKPVRDSTKPYCDIVKHNDSFIKYYKTIGICSDDEWDEFLYAIKQDLPTSFRVTGNISEAKALLKLIKSQLFMDCLKGESDDTLDLKPFNLPWYPDGLAWQLHLTRKDIRRSEAYFKLHNFLISETAAGSISRQEVVSMIPPIVLDVQPHHKVLDMCAAPGSKTAQLIENLHKSNVGAQPTGFVIANDVDNNRCYMLVHQAKRLNSPNILITNHDSSLFPNLKINENGKEKKLKFDRILCDVPCSGDGTLRKNPDIWLKWNPANGANLHGIQFRIVKRGVELLEVGGRLVYSTCSLNPIENESVVHRILSEANGSLRLVQPSVLVPGLKYNPGMTSWKLASKDLVFYDKFEDVPEKWQTCIRPQMFPPKPEDSPKYCLEKCMRILPHHQDTGGFFVAVFEKLNNMPWEIDSSKQQENKVIDKTELEPEIKPTDNNDASKDVKPAASGSPRKKNRFGGYREDPFVFFKDNEDVWQSIKDFYFLDDNFDPKCLLTRCLVGKKKNIYFCSAAVRDLVINNECRIKIINTGVKTFVRCDNKNMSCAFRLAQEGLGSLFPMIGNQRKFSLLKEDLITLLQCDDPTRPPEIESLSEHIQNQVKDISGGSCVLTYTHEEFKLKMVGWRGTKSLRAYTAREDTIHMLRILGADISKFDINKFKKIEEMVTEELKQKADMKEEIQT